MKYPLKIQEQLNSKEVAIWQAGPTLSLEVQAAEALAIELSSYKEFVSLQKQNLVRIQKNLKSAGVESVCLEGAHVYTDETIKSEHLYSMKVCAHLQKYLEDAGLTVTTLLFIDDYNSELPNNHFDLKSYLKIAKELGLEFDSVVAESSMTPLASAIVETLVQLNEVYEENGKSLLNNPKITLINQNGKYSCQLLDAALTLQKLYTHDGAINLLDKFYKSQQAKVRKLLKKILGQTPPGFMSLYTKNLPKLSAEKLKDAHEIKQETAENQEELHQKIINLLGT